MINTTQLKRELLNIIHKELLILTCIRTGYFDIYALVTKIINANNLKTKKDKIKFLHNLLDSLKDTKTSDLFDILDNIITNEEFDL